MSRRLSEHSTPRLLTISVLVLAAALSACGQKAETKPGQALANVNGEEITVMQLNEELVRSNVAPAQQDAARKQLLQALIDRQLLIAEATKEKIDRDPKVVQSIERAKSMILAQSYLQRRVGNVARPTKAEVQSYFDSNPAFFASRKIVEMRQLVLDSRDVTDAVKKAIDGSKSIEEVAAWLETNKVKFAPGQLVRNTAELPPQLTSRLLAMPKGQLFIIREGERSMLMSVAAVKDAPVTLDRATPQIEQFLVSKKNKELADVEIKRLRAGAKIEYTNKADAAPATPPAAPAGTAPAAATVPAAAVPAATVPAAPADAAANERGVAGLR